MDQLAPHDGTVHFATKDLPLRRDVGWLGQLLGRLLIELGPDDLFPAVETSRRLARKRRRGDARGEARTTEFAAGVMRPSKRTARGRGAL